MWISFQRLELDASQFAYFGAGVALHCEWRPFVFFLVDLSDI